MSIAKNIEDIRQRIADAAKRVNRDPSEILLLAVTKTVDLERIRQAVDAGLSELGENRVQEMIPKFDEIDRKVDWHLIGTLQKNKVKYIINKVKLVHSLCSVSVAEEMQRLCEKNNTHIDVLIEVNVTGEESKSGIPILEIRAFINSISKLDRVHVKGLMTIARYSPDPEDARPCFKELKGLFEELKDRKEENFEMKYLSMGMSGDYEVAIEEGANIVRVGSAIFGERVYK